MALAVRTQILRLTSSSVFLCLSCRYILSLEVPSFVASSRCSRRADLYWDTADGLSCPSKLSIPSIICFLTSSKMLWTYRYMYHTYHACTKDMTYWVLSCSYTVPIYLLLCVLYSCLPQCLLSSLIQEFLSTLHELNNSLFFPSRFFTVPIPTYVSNIITLHWSAADKVLCTQAIITIRTMFSRQQTTWHEYPFRH